MLMKELPYLLSKAFSKACGTVLAITIEINSNIKTCHLEIFKACLSVVAELSKSFLATYM